jgi:alpha-galactosidase
MRRLFGPARLTFLLVVALTLTAPATIQAAAGSPLKVFLLAGQSNMEGQAVADLDGKDYNDGKGPLVRLMQDPAKAAMLGHLRDAQGRWAVRDDVWVRYRREQGPLLRRPGNAW